MSGAAVDAEYAALAADYDDDWAVYNRATAERTLRAVRDRAGEPGRALDVGCGTGTLLERLTTTAATVAVGLDRSAEMLTVARRRLPGTPLARGDAAALPFADASFDAAATNSALHYADDPAGCVRELARVTKPGGTVVWTDWDAGALTTRGVIAWLRLTRRPLGRALSATAMAAALTDAGLTDVRVDRWRHGWLWGLATVSGRKPG
ncbi:class I SAM-dependent methyltransferase [Alienimonas californiensis]|uniref:Demethylrebeccamycin-D-glucose O-methyltransferase n=1 Tax=Alienimonas californiensis TaxID=2527989 RepID=A0A517P3M3_9PLAN|nr:class I SAM-dependent methyltransferase [Alienimonas californiensis]QDT13963.1 Demethylrebeccamycin-D-glucose O-methyltransferase [Alienimonas californiensis]